MTQLGVDYASVDGNAPPDFAEARKAGLSFAYIRRSHAYRTPRGCVLAADPCYARDAARARLAGLTVGAFLFPSFAVGAPSPAEQLANFESAGGDVLPGTDLPVALDVEMTGRGIQDTGRSKEEVFELVLEFLRLMRARYRTVAVYTSHVQWHDDNGLGGPSSPELDGVVLWIKTPYRLRAGQRVDSVMYREPHFAMDRNDSGSYWRVPDPWHDQGWWIQQGQGDTVGFAGFSHTVDVDHFEPLSARSGGDNAMLRRCWVRAQLTGRGLDASDLFAAVRQFQSSHGLVADGVVGVRTFAALCG